MWIWDCELGVILGVDLSIIFSYDWGGGELNDMLVVFDYVLLFYSVL